MKLFNIHKCNQQSRTVTKTISGMDGSLFIHCKTKLTGVFTRLWWNDAVLNSLKPLSTSTTKKQIPSNPFLPVPQRNKLPQTPFYQYHKETNYHKPLSTSTTKKQIPSNPFPPVPQRYKFPQTPFYQYHKETNSLKPLSTSTTKKQIPLNPFYQYHKETNSPKPFLPVPQRNKFPQTPFYQYHAETNSLKPLPTSIAQKQIFHAPITPSKQPNFRQMPEESHTCYSGLQSCKSTLFLQLHMHAHQDLTKKKKDQKKGTLM